MDLWYGHSGAVVLLLTEGGSSVEYMAALPPNDAVPTASCAALVCSSRRNAASVPKPYRKEGGILRERERAKRQRAVMARKASGMKPRREPIVQSNPQNAGPVARENEASVCPTPFTVPRCRAGALLLIMTKLPEKDSDKKVFFNSTTRHMIPHPSQVLRWSQKLPTSQVKDTMDRDTYR